MKKISRVFAVCLAAVLLLSGCGKDSGKSKGKHTDKVEEELSGVDMNYEDLVDRPDRNIADCIQEKDISTIMGVTMRLMPNHTAEKANYESEDASYLLTLVLRNMSLEEFNTMAADPAMWKMQVDLGEAAYWNTDQTELIAYQNGYAVSIALNRTNTDAMRRMMEIVLSNLG